MRVSYAWCIMKAMSKDWARLGRAVKAARLERHLTQAELATALGLDESTVQNLETARFGQGFNRMPSSARHAAQYFDWAAGSLDAILDGGEPGASVTAGPESDRPGATQALRADLPLRIVHELKGEGPLLDTTVMELPNTAPNVTLTIVVQGTPEASPEDIARGIQAWRQAERRLKDLDGPGPGDVADEA